MDIAKGSEIASAKCDCCGLTEECTEGYIKRVRDRYMGRWICGLCAEAVKDETEKRIISNEEALNKHMSFCNEFKNDLMSSPPKNPTQELISAIKQLLLRTKKSDCGVRVLEISDL